MSAKGVICVDFDGTLFPWDEDLWADNPPTQGAREAMLILHDMGYTIMVYSSRLSEGWTMDADQDIGEHHEHMEKLCKKYGVIHDGFAWDKIKADFYIDDRAIHFDGDWAAAVSQVKDRE